MRKEQVMLGVMRMKVLFLDDVSRINKQQSTKEMGPYLPNLLFPATFIEICAE
jgi:hypothetical protein